MTDPSQSDLEELRAAVRAAVDEHGVTKVAHAITVARGTVYNLLDEQHIPGRRTVSKVRRWRDRDRWVGLDFVEGRDPGESEVSSILELDLSAAPDSAELDLLAFLLERVDLDVLARALAQDRLLRAAYSIALDEGWPAESMAELDELRDQIMGRGQSGPPPGEAPDPSGQDVAGTRPPGGKRRSEGSGTEDD